MPPGTLTLVPYHPAWPDAYAAEAARVRDALGSLARGVEHVGSTAVPGMLAKPVIDLAVAVATVADADACVAPLTALGWAYRGLHGDDPRRRYYVRERAGRRVAQLHLWILPATGWDEHLRFRDALRADPGLAAAYAAEKRRVADLVAWDKRAYSETKGPFIRRALDALRDAAAGEAGDPRPGGERSRATADDRG